MLLDEIYLTERVHDVVFHATTIASAVPIITNWQFRLSSTVGTSFEQKLDPLRYPYYLSLTRSRAGDYHARGTGGGVVFKLRGEWFNQRYRSFPVDYWERSWQHSRGERTSEQEDRVVSQDPTIPADAIQEVHVWASSWDSRPHILRALWLAAKKRKVPIWFYGKKSHWLMQDRRNALTPSELADQLRGVQTYHKAWSTSDYIKPWLELMQNSRPDQLSERARFIASELVRYYRRPSDSLGLDNELANNRRPGAAGRRSAEKLIALMQQRKLTTPAEVADHLYRKWTAISIAQQHGVPSQDIVKQFLMGVRVETEHTSDPALAFKIAADHLREDPQYYTKLASLNL